MKKFSKMISMLLSLAISSTLLPMAVGANAVSETVWYENDFNKATVQEALPTYENDYLKVFGFTKNADGKYIDDIEGNNPDFSNGVLYKVKGAGINGRTILMDFTKGGTKSGVSEGVLKISFDAAVRGGALSDSYTQSMLGMNMSAFSAGGRMMYFDATGYDVKEIIGDYPHEATVFMDTEIHSYDIIFSYPDQKAYLYVDSSLAHTWTNLYDRWKVINNFSIGFNGDMKAFDNLKVSELNNNEYTFEITSQENAVGYVDVCFDAVMNTEKGTFIINGAPADNVEWLDLKTARVYSNMLYNGGTYDIAVVEAADFFKKAPSNESVEITLTEIPAEEVLYYNDFESYTSSSVDVTFSNEYFDLARKTGGAPSIVEVSGNKGIKMAPGAGPSRTFYFDFTKNGGKEGLSTGTYKISYDFSFADSWTYAETTWTGVNMTDHYNGTRWASENSGRIFTAGNGKSSALAAGQIASVDMIVNLDNDTVVFYLDGAKLGDTTCAGTINNFQICLSSLFGYFDNLKISKLNADALKYVPTVSSDETEENYVELSFPTVMDTQKKGFVIDGAEASKVEWISVSKVRVYGASLATKGEHRIGFTDVLNIYGVAPAVESIAFTTKNWDDDFVIFETTFNDGDADLTTFTKNGITGGFYADRAKDVKYPVVNTNPGFKTGRTTDGRMFFFDFTSQNDGKGISTGKIKVSFDFIFQNTNDWGETATIIIDSESFAKGNIFAEFGRVLVEGSEDEYIGRFYAEHSPESWCNTGVTKTFSMGEMHTYDIILNLDTQYPIITGTHYIDGKKVSLPYTQECGKEFMKTLAVCLNDSFRYIDNFKVSYITSESFAVEGMAAPVAGNDYVEFYTTEQYASGNVTVLAGNTPVAVSEVTTSVVGGSMENDTRYVVKATLAEKVLADTEYTVTLASDAKTVMGNTVNKSRNTASAESVALETSLAIENGVVNVVVGNNGASDMSPVVMVATYEDGRMIGVKTYSAYVVDGTATNKVESGKIGTRSIDVSSLEGTVKAFLVDGLTNIKPLAENVNN